LFILNRKISPQMKQMLKWRLWRTSDATSPRTLHMAKQATGIHTSRYWIPAVCKYSIPLWQLLNCQIIV